MTDREIEALFAAARAHPAEPSAALLARVMEDAMIEASACALPDRAPVRHAARRGVLAALVAAIGGWPAMGGLATAGLVGVWIGYAAPAGLDTVTSDVFGDGYEVSDLVPSLDSYLAEG
jgi:hypothetical protein